MIIGQEQKTDQGSFREDLSGLWHYQPEAGCNVEQAVEDALKNRPGVAWFWFNGTFCPIFTTDNVDALLRRWEQWRKIYQSDPGESLITLLEKLATENRTE